MSMINQKFGLGEFFGRNINAQGEPVRVFWTGTGWHLYSFLDITQRLTSANDDWGVTKILKIYSKLLGIADTVCECNSTVHLLEFQGNILHFFVEADRTQVMIIKAVAEQITAMVTKELEPKAGNHFLGFRQAADFGNTVMLRVPAIESACASLISLSPSANEPAKKLRDGAGNGVVRPLWVKTEYLNGNVDRRAIWTAVETKREEVLTEQLSTVLNRRIGVEPLLESVAGWRNHVTLANRAAPYEPTVTELHTPTEQNGTMFRADLNGFTKLVEKAFQDGKIRELVEHFFTIFDTARAWQERKAEDVVSLPWAGDCANYLIKKRTIENESVAYSYQPVQSARGWFDHFAEVAKSSGFPQMETGSLGWVVCTCVGGLVAVDIKADERTFRVICGEPAGQTQKGVNTDDTRSGDLVMDNDSVTKLKKDYQDIFSPHKADFKKTTHAKILEKDGELLRKPLAIGSARQVAAGITTIASRVYG